MITGTYVGSSVLAGLVELAFGVKAERVALEHRDAVDGRGGRRRLLTRLGQTPCRIRTPSARVGAQTLGTARAQGNEGK